jgi:AraC family transcriptional regulator of adaptative response/methylated-DNA-[protein]-cysteine methyltransferase
MIGLLVVQALRVAGCKQIIAKDGALSGFGGGVWRKRQLLDLERNGKLPASL